MRIAAHNKERMISARNIVARQVDQLARLVDDLLDVSLITQDKIQFRFELLDLVSVVSQAADAGRPIFSECGIQFSMTLCERPVRVRGDAVRLSQVISNLLRNAAKFTQKDGAVSLVMDRGEGDVALRIADNGIGIPQDMLGRVFDLFTQVDSSRARSQGGLGIGLTLVKRIVEVHGGSIDVESAGEGCGSTFTIHLPVLADQIHTPAEQVAVARVGSPMASSSG
jgi:signal transduction histidine kinase